MDNSLNISVQTEIINPADIPSEIKEQVKGNFPIFFSPDEDDRYEEVTKQIYSLHPSYFHPPLTHTKMLTYY